MRPKRVLVAGASTGMGLAIAQTLVDAGDTVYALARRLNALEDGAGRDRLASGRFRPRAADVTNQAAVAQCVDGALAEGDLDSVIYVAGLNVPQRQLAVLQAQAWEQVILTGLTGAFYVVGRCLESLRRTRGSVIFIGSASAVWPNSSGASYQAAKAGLLAFSRAANFEEHARGVRFTTLSVGLVDTAHLRHRQRPPGPDVLANCLKPEDVARTCQFILSLPERACLPELVLLPTLLQAPGDTDFKY